MNFAIEMVSGILMLSVGFNLWILKKIYNEQSYLNYEIHNTQNNVQKLQSEMIRDYMTKEEFNRQYDQISGQLQANNEELKKKLDHMEKSFEKRIDTLEDHMITKEQYESDKERFKKKGEDNGK